MQPILVSHLRDFGNKACVTDTAAMLRGSVHARWGNHSSRVKPSPPEKSGEVTAKDKRRKSEEKQG